MQRLRPGSFIHPLSLFFKIVPEDLGIWGMEYGGRIRERGA